MKTIILAMAIGMMSTPSYAAEFKFKWQLKDGALQYKTEAESWEVAFRRAAKFCFDFAIKREKNLTEEAGLDIIDICANPR